MGVAVGKGTWGCSMCWCLCDHGKGVRGRAWVGGRHGEKGRHGEEGGMGRRGGVERKGGMGGGRHEEEWRDGEEGGMRRHGEKGRHGEEGKMVEDCSYITHATDVVLAMCMHSASSIKHT